MLNIALIDDDQTTNFINKTKLSKALPDAVILTFNNGLEALNHIKEHTISFDFALLDLNMPVMNGLTFLQHHHELSEDIKIKKTVLFIDKTIDQNFTQQYNLHKTIQKPLTPEKISLIFNHD